MIGACNNNDTTVGYRAGTSNNKTIDKPTYVVHGGARDTSGYFNHFTTVIGATAPASSMQPYITVSRWIRVA